MFPDDLDTAFVVGTHVALFSNGCLSLHSDSTASSQPGGHAVVRSVGPTPAGGSEPDRVASVLAGGRVVTTADLIDDVDRRCGIVVSGHQPSYHPYTPLLAKAAIANVFTFADDMAFGRQKFQHRQRVLQGGKEVWLTLPIVRSERRTSIRDKLIGSGRDWRSEHWNQIRRAFGSRPHFDEQAEYLERVYSATWVSLADLNFALWLPLAKALCPHTLFGSSSALHFDDSGRKGDRIAEELKTIGGPGYYVAGAASGYLSEASDRLPGSSFRQAIESAGFEVMRVSFDQQSWEAATSVSATATALEFVATEGPAARDILQSAYRLTPYDDE